MNNTQPGRALDRRQRKTRTAIEDALLSLLKEKSIDNITISELTNLADVNRKTFYNHYTNLQQVRNELEQQYIDLFFSYLRTAPETDPRERPTWFVHCLVNYIRTKPKRARLLFESGESLCLAQRFKELSIPYLKQYAERYHLHAEYVMCCVEYMVNGLVALLNLWIHSDPQLSPEEFEGVATSLLCSGGYTMLGLSAEN